MFYLFCSAVASDRLAIESEGVLPEELSPQHLISCNDRGQSGCEGGYLDKAWWFLRKNGYVSVNQDKLIIITTPL